MLSDVRLSLLYIPISKQVWFTLASVEMRRRVETLGDCVAIGIGNGILKRSLHDITSGVANETAIDCIQCVAPGECNIGIR